MVTLNDLTNTINSIQDDLNQNENPLNTQRNAFESEGFIVPPVYSADGNGLPYNKVKSFAKGKIRRNIITWFVPEFGTVKMYINPNNISYKHKKLISKERTKGGFSLQYWGEDLSTMTISGTTGSSGIEGINMLYEIYRGEQYAFDGFGLTLESNNASNDLANNIVNEVGGLFDNTGEAAGLIGGLVGLDSVNSSLANKNIPSLAQLAFSVEMYYDGWVYRGYFDSMSFTEKADNFLWDYTMEFVITQKRGYRTNYLPFHRSPIGPSEYNTPHSFSKNLIK
jgi:hypothetical protein